MCREVLRWSTTATICLLFPAATAACLPTEDSWTQTSPGGEYILVMVSPKPVANDQGNRPLDPTRGGARLRDKYLESGLYRNDGSSQPLWPIPFIDGGWPAHVAPDGRYVVFDADQCSLGWHAATIFADGRHVVTHWKHNLIPCYYSKKFLAMLCNWRDAEPLRGELDHEKRTYTITTGQGEVFVLDVANGQLLRHISRWPRYVLSFALLVPIAVVLIWHRDWIRSLISRAGWNLSRQETSRSLKPTWTRFSLRSVLGGITLLCVVLAFRKLVVLGVFLGAAVVIAGVVAIFVRRSFRSFLIGAVLGCYGCVLAFVLGDLIGQRLSSSGTAHGYLLLWAPFGGLLLGALVAGIIERNYKP